jgi:hypothetical protein
MTVLRLCLIVVLVLCVASQGRTRRTAGSRSARHGRGNTAQTHDKGATTGDEKADSAAFLTSLRQNTVDAYAGYLERFPSGRFSQVARDSLIVRKAQRDKQDAAAYGEASAKNTREAYRSYLAEYPQGLHADEARRAIDGLKTQAATSPQDKAKLDGVVGELAYLDGLIERSEEAINGENREGAKRGQIDKGIINEHTMTIALAQDSVRKYGAEYRVLAGVPDDSEFVAPEAMYGDSQPEYFERLQAARRPQSGGSGTSVQRAAAVSSGLRTAARGAQMPKTVRADRAIGVLFGGRAGEVTYDGSDSTTIRINSVYADEQWIELIKTSHYDDTLADFGYKEVILTNGGLSWTLRL